MDLMLMFLDERGVRSFFKKERKKLVKKKRELLGNLRSFLEVRGVVEKQLCRAANLSSRCYYLKLSTAVSRLLGALIEDLEVSQNAYPKIALNRKLMDIITEINGIQGSQQSFVDNFAANPAHIPAAAADTRPPRSPRPHTSSHHHHYHPSTPPTALDAEKDDEDFADHL